MLLDQMPAWGLSAVGGSIIIVSALAADMALVHIHGYAFADGSLRPRTFPGSSGQAFTSHDLGDDAISNDGTGSSKASAIGLLQAAAEAQRVSSNSHAFGQRLPTWGPHDYATHPNYALLQAKALQQGSNNETPASMSADASMVQPGGQLAVERLLEARETASRWWYTVSSSPAWPLGLILSAGKCLHCWSSRGL